MPKVLGVELPIFDAADYRSLYFARRCADGINRMLRLHKDTPAVAVLSREKRACLAVNLFSVCIGRYAGWNMYLQLGHRLDQRARGSGLFERDPVSEREFLDRAREDLKWRIEQEACKTVSLTGEGHELIRYYSTFAREYEGRNDE